VCVCFGRNANNSLERLFVSCEERTHAAVASMENAEVRRIRAEVVTKRSFYHDGSVSYRGFFDELWGKKISRRR
jgi:hypothetical protein